MTAPRPVLVALLFIAAGFAGCTSDSGASEDIPPIIQRRGVPVANLNASLLDTARFAVDARFGPDEPLTLEDIPRLLPSVLTDYNTTLPYLLNMSLYPTSNVTQIGDSLEGRAVFGFLITDDGQYHADRPSVMLTCSQHGNEPSGSEACLIFIEYFTHGVDEFAEKVRSTINLAINPLANPDGKQANRRGNYEQTDINRDHMNLATLEGRAIHRLANMVDPVIGLDLHEFGGVGTQPPVAPPVPVTTWNTFQVGMPHGVLQGDRDLYASNVRLMLEVNLRMSEKFGYGSSSYYNGGTSLGSDPSVHRHHFILRNAHSLLFETGGGLGVNNLPLRVDSQITATFAVLNYFFANQESMVGLAKAADESAKAPVAGIQGWLIPPQKDSEKAMNFLGLHGVEYKVLETDTQFPLVADYKAPPAGAPGARSFPNGTLHVERFQALGRLAHELFEFDDDTYYNKGPRAWPLEVYRVLQVP